METSFQECFKGYSTENEDKIRRISQDLCLNGNQARMPY